MRVSFDKNLPQTILDDEDDSKVLVKKAGFVSLKDRIRNFNDQCNDLNRGRRVRPGSTTGSGQFATLQELFASRCNSARRQNDHDDFCRQPKPKVPIMKLNKDDWNVKCWEDRLKLHKRRHGTEANESRRDLIERTGTKPRQPRKQIEVFQGRIEEVASKLERAREGIPTDEKLHQLVSSTNRRAKVSHEWTDLLKSELENGTHDPKLIKSKIVGAGKLKLEKAEAKSPLGRPIRKLNQDDEDAEPGK